VLCILGAHRDFGAEHVGPYLRCICNAGYFLLLFCAEEVLLECR